MQRLQSKLANCGIQLTEDEVANAIANAQLAHRFQEITPECFLDGAHNPAAAKALANTIRIGISGRKSRFCYRNVKRKGY